MKSFVTRCFQQSAAGAGSPELLLLVDNRDSFTWNLAHLLAGVWKEPQVLEAGKALELLKTGQKPDALVLSPGPGRPEEHPGMLSCLDLVLGRIPLLGICLGHQAIGLKAGCVLEEAARPEHGHVWDLHHKGEGLFEGLAADLRVMRYHSLHLASRPWPAVLKQDAWTEDGSPMSIRWDERKAWGLQFHPESFLSEEGAGIIRNFRKRAGNS